MMRISMLLALSFVLGGVSSVLGQGGDVKPLPLPKTIRVQSAAPRGEVWAKLSPKEKMLAYHLIQAANAGRELLVSANAPALLDHQESARRSPLSRADPENEEPAR